MVTGRKTTVRLTRGERAKQGGEGRRTFYGRDEGEAHAPLPTYVGGAWGGDRPRRPSPFKGKRKEEGEGKLYTQERKGCLFEPSNSALQNRKNFQWSSTDIGQERRRGESGQREKGQKSREETSSNAPGAGTPGTVIQA